MSDTGIKRHAPTALGVLAVLLVVMIGVSVGLALLVPSGWRNAATRQRTWRTDQFSWVPSR